MDLPASPASPASDPAAGGSEREAGGGDPEWLIDADDPLLTADRLARVADPHLPDRLAWNTFRTLAVWDTDVWVARLLSVACGPDNPLTPLDWGDASVLPWAVGPFGPDVTDVVIDGPEAYLVLACSLRDDPSEEQLRAAALAALDGSLHDARQAGFVVVGPPGADALYGRAEVAAATELLDGRIASDLLAGAVGSISWTDLGRLALDLAEEGDPLTEPVETVRRLVTELQELYPGATL